MQISVELLLGIGLALTLPLLGVVAGCLYAMRADMKALTKTVDSFKSFFESIQSSLGHNRDEHTQMMAISQAVLKEVADSKQDVVERIALAEERLRK